MSHHSISVCNGKIPVFPKIRRARESVIVKILEFIGKLLLLMGLATVFSMPFMLNISNANFSLAGQDVALILAVFSMYGLFERRRGWKLGLGQRDGWVRFAEGAGFGMALISIVVLMIFVFGGARIIEVRFTPPVLQSAWQTLILFLLVGLSEELMSRGYVQGLLRHRFNKWVAWSVSAFLFALLHGFNPGVWSHGFPVLNLMLVGVLFSVYRDVSGGLWAPIGFHFTWNFFQGPVYGFKVSGLEMQSFLQIRSQGGLFLSGGAFGPEGSVACTIVLLAATSWLIWRERNTQTAVPS